MWECRNGTKRVGQQTGLSSSGPTGALSAWKRWLRPDTQTDRRMAGETEDRGVGRLGGARGSWEPGSAQRKQPTLQAWEPLEPQGEGLFCQPRAASHQLGF